ncbi:MAG: hypothetical protein ACXWC7_17860 [Chitinophagaceae bacterium]
MKHSTINREWHLHHKMPQHATVEQRIQWHLEHLKNCQCRRDLPVGIKAEMKKRNIAVPRVLTTNTIATDSHR